MTRETVKTSNIIEEVLADIRARDVDLVKEIRDMFSAEKLFFDNESEKA